MSHRSKTGSKQTKAMPSALPLLHFAGKEAGSQKSKPGTFNIE
jgi:hypothetical protein